MRVKYAVASETVMTEWGNMNTSHAVCNAKTEAPTPEASADTFVSTRPAT